MDSGQALDVARVLVQQVETVIPATKNIIRRKKIQKSCLSGLHSSENPLFHQCIPLAEPSEPGGSILPPPPQVLSVIEAKPVKMKDLLFLLAPPRYSDLPTALSLLSIPTISESFSTCTSGPAEQGGGQLPP